MTEPAATPDAITSDQATEMVGKHLLALLEQIMEAHKAVLDDPAKSEIQKENARLVIAAAQGIGRPLFHVVKIAGRPRILRQERSIRLVR